MRTWDRDRSLSLIVVEIETGASDAETGGKGVKSRLAQEQREAYLGGKDNQGLAAFGDQKAGQAQGAGIVGQLKLTEFHWEEEGVGDDSWKLGERGSMEFKTGEGTFHS